MSCVKADVEPYHIIETYRPPGPICGTPTPLRHDITRWLTG